MDASGFVTAVSEVIRFEKGCGIIFTVYNVCMNFNFYIVAKDTKVNEWKRIFVNHHYNFSNLKIGCLELVSGIKQIVILTSSESQYQEILVHSLKKFIIPNHLMEKISIPIVTLNSEIHSYSKLISYQARKVLVCCGLSSVRSLKLEVETADNSSIVNFSHYPLSIFDIIWLEMLLQKLNTLFCPAVISDDFTFHWENEILYNILDCFSVPLTEIPHSERQSIGEEYCSNPHFCSVFCDDILPTGSEVLFISEILNKANKRISWIENSKNWKVSFVKNEKNHILIGMLYLSKDGCWYIMDKSCNIPLVLTRSCDQCRYLKNMFCSFENLNLGYLIALQNFDIVHEKLNYDFSDCNYYRYLKTSCCYLFYLGTFSKRNDNSYNLVCLQENPPLPISIDNSVEEISQKLKRTYIEDSQYSLTDTERNFSVSSYNGDIYNNSNNASQCVLVLNKIWTIVNQTFVCYQLIVLLLSVEDICKACLDKSKSLFEDSYNFYETEDDYEFAELVNQIDSLYLENKPRLARLHFESAKQCALMLPGHIYTLDFSEKLNKDIKISRVSERKPVLIKVKWNMKVLHHAECFGNHRSDDFEISVFNNIKQIISERKIQDNYIIRAVLNDKLYEERYSDSCSQSEVDEEKTLCLILKNCNSEDTIKVYLPYCPKNMFGFLPGVQLQLWGFVCICSKRGYLYLKPASSFGIQILNSETFCADDSLILESSELHSELKVSSLRHIPVNVFFKCLCFIVKIISAKLQLVCSSCGKELIQKCSCLCTYTVKLKISFIIDDGTSKMLAYSSDEIARKILMLKENEWKKLSSLVTATKRCLNFHYKVKDSLSDSSSLMERVFSVYCSSKFICRQVCLKCRKKSGGSRGEQPSVWCHDLFPIRETDLIPEFIIKLKNIFT